MAYTAWEVTAGDALEQVAVFCKHLIKTASSFTIDTNPPLAEVEAFLTNNYSVMSGILFRYGISNAQTDNDIKRALMSYQVAYTVVDCENTSPVTGSFKENPRMALFQKKADMFVEALKQGHIQSMPNIVLVGGTAADTHYPEWTGSSIARKNTLASNTDLVQPDITREMMKSDR